MLTDQDRARIRAEEAFRHEMRRELAPPPEPAKPDAPKATPTRWARFMAFANTSFGIWLLSTVALGGISSGYQILSHHFEQVRADEIRAHRLHSEIVNRLDQMTEKMLEGRSREVALGSLKEIDSGSVKIFDDLYEKNVLSLLAQLHELASPEEQRQIERAEGILRDIVLLHRRMKHAPPGAPPMSDQEAYDKLAAALEQIKSLKLYKAYSARIR